MEKAYHCSYMSIAKADAKCTDSHQFKSISYISIISEIN
jgi:hypothetical protein